MVETPPAENKPRKQQLSEEQPSGNGVKKPKVSVGSRELAGKLPASSQEVPHKGLARRGLRHSSPDSQC